MSNVLSYPAVSTDDLDDLPPEERDYRRKLRFSIARGMPHQETADERAYHERQKAKDAKQQAAARGLAAVERYRAAKQAQPANRAAADSAFLWQFVRAVSPVMNEALAEVIAHDRAAMHKHVAEQVKVCGELPEIQLWQEETIYKKGMVVTHNNAWWQAKQDTAQQPNSAASQWTKVVSSETSAINKRFGAMRHSLRNEISTLRDDIETLKRENKMLRERVTKTAAATTQALTIKSWLIQAEHYRATPFMSDSTPGPSINLRALFETYLQQTS